MRKYKVTITTTGSVNPLPSIKELREAFGIGLKEAKDAFDTLRYGGSVTLESSHLLKERWSNFTLENLTSVEIYNIEVAIKDIVKEAIDCDKFDVAERLIEALKYGKF